eukprot:2676495-Rhodomonas_salina.2
MPGPHASSVPHTTSGALTPHARGHTPAHAVSRTTAPHTARTANVSGSKAGPREGVAGLKGLRASLRHDVRVAQALRPRLDVAVGEGLDQRLLHRPDNTPSLSASNRALRARTHPPPMPVSRAAYSTRLHVSIAHRLAPYASAVSHTA